MMRLTVALTGLGLFISHAAGQYQHQQQQWQDFGAMPALMKQSFYDAVARPASLVKRDGDCGDGRHPCSDLNSTLCCPNTDYCIINSTLQVQCCELGSTCGMTCGTGSYYAEVTITETTTITSSGGSTTVSTKTDTEPACVGRPCVGTNYLCPQSMGGNCCAYGQACASSRQCLDFGGGGATTGTGAGALPGPTLATMIPSGCSRQGDTPCSVGTSTGCCGAGYTCAVDAASRAVCSPAPSTPAPAPAPTGSDVSVVSSSQGGGLSTAATAGIAVGVVAASALAIGAATWFCLRRRRRAGGARSTTTTSANEMGSGVGRHNRLAAAGRYESDDGGIRAYGPSSGPHMSEADGSSAHGGGGAGPLPGLGRDYFGPAAAAGGPYATPPDQQQHPSYFFGAGDGDHNNNNNVRPVRGDHGGAPHGPGDITSAVEIGEDGLVAKREKGASEEEAGGGGGGLAARRQDMRQGAGMGSPAVRDSIAGRFELYGTDVPAAVADGRAPRPLGTPGSELSASELGTPSPMSHEEQQAQQQGGKKGPAG